MKILFDFVFFLFNNSFLKNEENYLFYNIQIHYYNIDLTNNGLKLLLNFVKINSNQMFEKYKFKADNDYSTDD